MKGYINVCEVEKYYGSEAGMTKAVDRVSFQVAEGEFVGVMGASGSGKTTLLNMLATIDSVTAGHIYYARTRADETVSNPAGSCSAAKQQTSTGKTGRTAAMQEAGRTYDTPVQYTDITELKPDQLAKFRKENLGFVFQDYNLLDPLTIGENIILAMTLQNKGRKEIKKESEEMMRLLGIWDIRDKFPYQVSGGQKQRCACARALINRPKLLLADEPTGALDSKAAETLLETFQQLNETKKATIFMVTHDAFSASYCSRILFLKDGRIFHELVRGQKNRRSFLNNILDVLSMTGSVSSQTTGFIDSSVTDSTDNCVKNSMIGSAAGGAYNAR